MVYDAPYRPSPPEVVKRMINLVDVRPSDIFYDLGSGDGRLVIAAAERGAQAFGIEKQDYLVRESLKKIKEERLDNAHIIQDDVFKCDFSDATVVTLYLIPPAHEKLKSRLKKLQKGARIVCHDFEIDWWARVLGYWPPEKVESYEWHRLYLYRI
jgi:16S rRNA A1518/A1519 N6-dimethyltransferase RsmA/KsgA/DIM1 with predicted DNA glycosylase/AP lyase activity